MHVGTWNVGSLNGKGAEAGEEYGLCMLFSGGEMRRAEFKDGWKDGYLSCSVLEMEIELVARRGAM